jgi:hypothetical protein
VKLQATVNWPDDVTQILDVDPMSLMRGPEVEPAEMN